MAKKNRLATMIVIILVGLVVVVGQFKFQVFTKAKDIVIGLVSGEKKDEKAKEGEGEEQAEEQEPIVVKAVKVQKSDFRDYLAFLGTAEGIAEVDLKFEVNGVIEFFNFREGDRVRKGDVVARINNRDAMLKVKYRKAKKEVAETAVESAEKKLEIYQDLYEIGAIIKSKLEETELELKNKQKEAAAAEIEIQSSKQELSKTYLKSPIDGIVGSRQAEPGELVTTNTDLVKLLDTSEIRIKVGIVEKDINKIEMGQEATYAIDTYSDKEFKAEIGSITPNITGKSRTLTITLNSDNEEGLIVPGMFVKGNITVYNKPDTIAIPIKAIEQKGEETFVFVVDEKNVAHQRPVKIGYTAIDEVQIDEGLSEGELVVTDTPIPLKEGAPVKIAEKDEASGEAPEGVGAEEAE